MSNKTNETMDGIFEVSPGDKPATSADKPARPPKPKVSLSRETKVGLAVVAALLVIFIVVLVVRLGGDGEQVADNYSPPAIDAAGSREPATKQTRDNAATGATVIPATTGNPTQSQFWDGQSKAKSTPARGNSVYGAPGTSIYGGAGNAGASAASDVDDASDTGAPQERNTFGHVPAAGQTNEADAVRGSAFQHSRPDPFGARQNIGSATIDGGGMAVSDDSESDGATADTAPASTFNDDLAGEAANGPAFGSDQRTANSQTAATSARSNPFERTNREKLGGPAAFRAQPASDSSEARGADAVEVAADDSELGGGDDNNDSKVSDGRLLPAKDIDLQPTPQRAPLSSVAKGNSKMTEAPPFSATRKSPAAAAQLDETVDDDRAAAAQPSRRAASSGQSYTVAANDTYWTIAQKAYGSGAYFKALYEHNRRQVDDADQLSAGMQLSLPDEATLQRLYPKLCPKPQRVAARGRATRTSAEVPATDATYVVKEGDTLYEVARRQLGRSSRWAEVYELNRDAIGEATDRLEPGTRLVLPVDMGDRGQRAETRGQRTGSRASATGFETK